MERALEVFGTSEDLLNLAGSPEGVRDLGLILGGDVVMLQERMAVGSYHMPKVQTDESTMVMAFTTAMLEDEAAKGAGWSVGNKLSELAGQSGAEAARNAIRSVNGQRVPDGALPGYPWTPKPSPRYWSGCSCPASIWTCSMRAPLLSWASSGNRWRPIS